MDEIIEHEHDGWRALCSGRGAEFYGAIMLPQGVMVMANGDVLSREDVVAALDGAPAWDTYAIDDPRIVEITDDVVALVYAGTGRRGDTEFRAAMTSVYARTDQGWQLALYQQTTTGA